MAGNVWDLILARIETKVNRHSFYTWFKPTSFLDDDGRTVSVKVPNDLFRDWLTKHYAGVIKEAIDEQTRHGTTISFVTDDTSAKPTPTDPPVLQAPVSQPRRTVAREKFLLGRTRHGSHGALHGRLHSHAPQPGHSQVLRTPDPTRQTSQSGLGGLHAKTSGHSQRYGAEQGKMASSSQHPLTSDTVARLCMGPIAWTTHIELHL